MKILTLFLINKKEPWINLVELLKEKKWKRTVREKKENLYVIRIYKMKKNRQFKSNKENGWSRRAAPSTCFDKFFLLRSYTVSRQKKVKIFGFIFKQFQRREAAIR